MVANAFAITSGRRHRYSALFPPDLGSNPAQPSVPPTVIIRGTTFNLTKTWRVIESSSGNDAYLELQCYDPHASQWVSVQYFNTTIASS
jgi:hypothetical protein